MAGSACVRRTHFGTPLTRFVAPYGAPPRAPVAGSAGSSTYASAYPHIPHTFCVHIGSPTESPNDTVSTTEDPSGSARMQFHFGTLFARFVAPLGAPPKTPVAAPACGSTLIPAHPSHVSWPHWELHRSPQWRCPHASAPPISAHPSHGSWPHRELHRRPQWHRPHAPDAHFGTPLTRFVAP